MGTQSRTELDPSHIMQVGTGFWASKTLLSAIELQLFTRLGTETMTGEQIGDCLGIRRQATYDFLDALVALGFLERDGDGPDGRYRNTAETAAFLDKQSPTYLGGVLERASAHTYHYWGGLTEALRTGQPQTESKYTTRKMFDELCRDPARLEQFMVAMAGAQFRNFCALAEKFDFSQYGTLCDAGGATGQLCTVLAARHPHLRCTSFDLPVIEPIAKKTIAAAGLEHRVKTASGDFFTDPLPQADVITMGNVLHDWSLDRKKHLIRSAYSTIPEEGAFIVVEDIIDDARRNNARGLMMSLNMLVTAGDGFNFTGRDLADWCREAGFRQVDILPLSGTASAGIAYK